ncbi:hypothetical protein K502DRAFT_348434 [Neoconidiobolus thromboides FSU 785]|nr:hypothetical protein K502DRAFT_348434 [Neoconidiobolus thromboides FSU 785]
MSNWKNVNNWHWTEKNCLPWATNYLTEKLKGLTAERDSYSVEIDNVDSITGDVNLNQRKGKIITLYDVVIKLKWTGVLPSGEKAKGHISVPEVAHDTDEDDFVFEVSIDNDTREKDAFRNIIRTLLKEQMIKVFLSFPKDLVEHHSKDVYIPKELLGTPAPVNTTGITNVQVLNEKSVKDTVVASVTKGEPKKVNTTTLNDTIEFVTSAAQLYAALTDSTLMSIWSRSDVQFGKEKGAPFRLFGGNISGELIELQENKKIQLKWRSNLWPESHYSIVTIELEELSGSVNLILKQEGVPVGQEDITRDNWNRFYWNSIKSTFG